MIGTDWVRGEILDPTDHEAMNTLFVPILRQHPQLSPMMVATSEGVEYLLLRDPLKPTVWTHRIVQAETLGAAGSSTAAGTPPPAESTSTSTSWTMTPARGSGAARPSRPRLARRSSGPSR